MIAALPVVVLYAKELQDLCALAKSATEIAELSSCPLTARLAGDLYQYAQDCARRMGHRLELDHFTQQFVALRLQ